MNSVGIICEYNPFHNGHLHHLNEIKKMFPEVTTIRMDTDTVTKKNSHETILKEFQEKKVDILIGS